ncbi:recombinase family protein [Saccharopolyspora rectivirgula]|uniref:recombinase family protein n=1 Tax=Saccharopolyspora rectivirgula TaxID=28042 RepID=UPI0009DE163B|nr:recombinase family protein [Saccharopolyspora rectivirgula]
MTTSADPPPPGLPRRGDSDLAISPFSLPAAVRGKEVRVAWVGRTSTEDHQDPRQSLLRQLERSKSVLPESWVIVTHFYDVESGRMELERRGRKAGYERFDIPIARDGGIADLLAEATRPNRRFDVVICETMSRIARKMYENLSVERQLEQAGVAVFASNEPIVLSGGRAQQILQRRINQSVAEYEVLNMLEQSWGGTCTHVREGYNIGKPCYGYRAKKYRHPNPVKAEKGITKTRLEPDGKQASTVTLIAKWRYHEQLGFDTIAERLNADLTEHPPPVPNGGKRTRGAWSKSSVADVLKNPKYTGYQVYNRRARRSRNGANNPPEKWVWSAEPAHEPLIPKWMFDELTARRESKRGSRDGAGENPHPATKRTYLLRGRVLCVCQRRMLGHRHRGQNYYRCWPKNNNRGRMDRLDDHPNTVYMREDVLLSALNDAYGTYLFSKDRLNLLADTVDQGVDQAELERVARRDRLNKQLAELTRKQDNLLAQAEDADPGDPFIKGLRERYNALVTQQEGIQHDLDDLERQQKETPRVPRLSDLELVDVLPHLSLNVHRAPTELVTRLFELTKLRIHVDHHTDRGVIEITLPATGAHDVAAVAAELPAPQQHANEQPMMQNKQVKAGVNAACAAPGALRRSASHLRKRAEEPILVCSGSRGGRFARPSARTRWPESLFGDHHVFGSAGSPAPPWSGHGCGAAWRSNTRPLDCLVAGLLTGQVPLHAC